jgi:hypothetical protein
MSALRARCLRLAAWHAGAMLAFTQQLLAQALPAAAPATEQQYLDLIDQRTEAGGNTAPELIEPLAALGELYFQQQDYERAAENFERARTLIRVNAGFDTPQELPLLARQVAAEEARGNAIKAWELEESLLQLATLNLDSLEALPVFLTAAKKRVDIWNRYRSGDHPPEIELGCYYDRSKYINAMLLHLPTQGATTETRSNCNAGDRRTVLIALLIDARKYQLLGVETLLQNGLYSSTELNQLVIEVLRMSDAIARRQLSTADPALSDMIVRLLTHEPEDSAAAVRRAEFLLQLADMNVMRARQARRMSGFATVHEQYQQVWEALVAEGVEADKLNEMFAPALPVVLPSYAANPLTRVPEAAAAGYIDIAFSISDKGTSRSVEILESSPNVPRSEIRKLQQIVDQSSFRPRIVDGMVVDMAPVTVRYYVSAPVPEPADVEECAGDDAVEGCE